MPFIPATDTSTTDSFGTGSEDETGLVDEATRQGPSTPRDLPRPRTGRHGPGEAPARLDSACSLGLDAAPPHGYPECHPGHHRPRQGRLVPLCRRAPAGISPLDRRRRRSSRTPRGFPAAPGRPVDPLVVRAESRRGRAVAVTDDGAPLDTARLSRLLVSGDERRPLLFADRAALRGAARRAQDSRAQLPALRHRALDPRLLHASLRNSRGARRGAGRDLVDPGRGRPGRGGHLAPGVSHRR